jgi:pimeloyl-ACP methyl ester carboxylesterase
MEVGLRHNKEHMNTINTSHKVKVNGINLHYIEYKNEKPKLLLLHGLTANAHAFEGLIQADLSDHFHIYSIDFRGRGLSDKTPFKYSIRHHAEDIIALLDYLQIDQISVCGHSFGGLVSTYLAYHFAQRISKVIVLDAAPKMNPNAGEMLGPALGRIDKRFENFDVYIESVKQAPYLTEWDEAMLVYYRADTATAEDGSVEPISNLADIVQVATHVAKEDWNLYFTSIEQPCLLVCALDDYTLSQPLLPNHLALQIVAKMKNSQYVEMHGNHQTMLFGKHAKFLVNAIVDFMDSAN